MDINKYLKKGFDLSLFSKYRTELMGVATIMILACHASPYGVEMSAGVRKLLGFGNLGVEVFFFLSGLGLYYSLRKQSGNLGSWYKKRYVRILLPYLLIAIPWFLAVCLFCHHSWTEFFLDVTTLSYWTAHRGAWFIAALIPLYLVAPVVFKVMTGNCRILFLVAVVSGIAIADALWWSDANNLWMNILNAIRRLPCFFCGMFAAKYIERKDSIPFLPALCIGIVITLFFRVVQAQWWFAIFLALPIICLALEKYPSLGRPLRFMGKISLESYVMNICLCDLLGRNIVKFIGGGFANNQLPVYCCYRNNHGVCSEQSGRKDG